MDEDNLQDENLPSQDNSLLEQLQTDLDSANNNWKRALADFENYKRRKEGENKELVEFAREVTVAKLLPTLDSLEQGILHRPKLEFGENQESEKKYIDWLNGLLGIEKQLGKVLEELGVKKIESVGKKFDPNFHEAVSQIESEVADDQVIEQVQTGYELNGKVIRPSQVIISKQIIK